jgi:hypothetical protein
MVLAAAAFAAGVYAKDFFEKNTNKNDLWMDNIINLRYREM